MEAVSEQDIVREGITPSWLALTLLLGAFAHTLACWLAFQMGFFHASNSVFYVLLGLSWLGNLGLFFGGLMRRGHRTDGLMSVILHWSAFVVLVSALFIDELRLCLMIFIFGILQATIFRAPRQTVKSLGIFTMAGYSLVLLIIFVQEPTRIDWNTELFQWGAYSLVLLGAMLLVLDIVDLQTALGRQNQRLKEVARRIEAMAIRDELTGLYNRRYAIERLERLSELAERSQFNLHLVYLDLDHFKRINDTYGHGFGDEVLKRFASVMQEGLFHRDFLARIGGEEFLMLLVQRTDEEAVQTVNLLIERWRNESFEQHPEVSMTLSAGLCARQPSFSVLDWLACADEALYDAKASGRNRAVTRVVTLDMG